MRRKIRIAFDCNVFASILLGGTTRQLFIKLLRSELRFQLFHCNTLIYEIRKLASIPYFSKRNITNETISAFLTEFQHQSTSIELVSDIKISRDIKDNYLLNLCVDAKLDFLVTGDKDLLIIRKYQDTEILNFRDFIDKNLKN